MGQNNTAGLGFPMSARQRASLSAVGRPYAPGSAMDPQSIGNMALRAAMASPLEITNGFEPAQAQPGQRPDDEDDGQSFANGGMVRGPGTGTSDSVKDKVPPGTFIMPADSTEKIGAERLAGLGFKPGQRPEAPQAPDVPLGFKPKSKREAEQPESAAQRGAGFGFSPKNVPVNLSNGEFRISPEQVHAIGAEVLEGIKDATHAEIRETPDQEAKEMEGEGDHVSRDALYFADGGMVDDPKKRSMATSPSNTYPGNQAEAAVNIYAKSNEDLASGARQVGGFVANAFPGTVVATQGAGKAVRDAYEQGGLGAAVGQGIRGSMVPAVGFADDVMGGVKRVLDPAAQALKTFVTGDATPIGQEKPAAAPSATGPATAATPSPQAAPPVATNPNYGNEPNAPANTNTNRAGTAPVANNVTREGNSYSGQNVGLGFTINGQEPRNGGYVAPGASSSGVGGSDVMGILQRESQIRAGMGALQDQINFNGGGYGFRKVGTDEAIRDMVVRGNSRDRAAALGFMGGRQDAADRYDLTRQDQALRQQDALSRQGIAAGEFGLKKEAQGFQSESQRRLQGLQQQYLDEADPAKKAEIERSIRLLGGQAAPKQPFQIAMSEEPLNPANPTAGTRKTPYVVDPATGVGRPVVPQKSVPTTMDRVKETAKARGMTEQQVIEILKQNGHQVSG